MGCISEFGLEKVDGCGSVVDFLQGVSGVVGDTFLVKFSVWNGNGTELVE